MTTTSCTMIRWRLREVMARERWTNRALAKELGVHETNVSNMKRRDDMPRIDGTTLNALCNTLKCTPSDLIDYTVDEVSES